MNRAIFILLFCFISPNVFCQSNWNGEQLVLRNNTISRIIVLNNGEFSTQSFRLKNYPYNFVGISGEEPNVLGIEQIQKFKWYGRENPEEFSFLLNDKKVTGKTGWKVLDIQQNKDGDTEINEVILQGTSDENRNLEITVSYLVYPDLPLIRKKIDFKNIGSEEIKIESLDVESLNIPWGNTHNVIYHNYARYKKIGPFLGNWDDPLIASHDPDYHHGIVIGNEAPGVLKRSSVCLDGFTINAGMTHVGQDYAFRKWMKPGEEWEGTWVFTGLYAGYDPTGFINGPVNDFVRNYLGIRLAKIEKRPAFVYNTWNPFRREVNIELVKELADAASACGVEEFIIDDGWQIGFGDWGIDYEKFPNGLKPVFDYIKSKGMKPGLWMSMGAASKDSKVFQEHPEWFAKYRGGDFINLHDGGTDRYSACFTTGWKDYIKGKILNLVKEHGLEYVKLDFAIVASAYRFDTDISGCFAENHPHKDRQESYLEIYRRAWQMYDELHEQAPKLFIDCTFETMGELQLVDYDMCKHAEGNWLSNFEDEAPFGSARIRQMSWWRSPAIPATALVIGNQSLDDEFALYSYKSLCGSLPIMLGDPRKVSSENQQRLKAMSGWLRAMEEKHSVMLFRQDLPGFGEPQHGSWDGFQRINTETKSGGIVGVFKQFAPASERWVTIKYLDPEKQYEVKLAPSGDIVKKASGKDLQEQGFKVFFEDDFQGELYEVVGMD